MRGKKSKIKKILITVLTMFLTFNITNKNIEAFKASGNLYNGKSGGKYEPPKVEAKVNDMHKITCEYNPNYGYNQEININAYDMKGNSIVPYSHISLSKFRAGTWIGINLREYKFTSWNVEIKEYGEIFKQYLCGWGLTQKGEKEKEECEKYNATVPQLKINWRACVTGAQACLATCKETGNCNQCPNCGKEPQERTCPSCTSPAGASLPYYYDLNHTIGKDLCWPDVFIQLISFGEIREPVDHNDALCEPKSIGTNGESEPQELIGAIKLKQDGCNAEAVKETARNGLSLLYPSLQFEIIDPNNYDKNKLNVLTFENNKLLRQEETIKATGEPESLIVSKDENHVRTFMPENFSKYVEKISLGNYKSYIKRAYRATYEYAIDNTCINVKNSNVFYNDNKCNTTSSNKEIKKIENGKTKDKFLNAGIDEEEDVEYWHYFIPLNTHTSYSDSKDVGFFFRISNKGNLSLETDECINMLNEYAINKNDNKMPNYMDFITPISSDGSTNIDFVGDYIEDKKGSSSQDMQLFTEQGYRCKYSIKANFNIEQKFYGESIEESGKEILKGYGFYYRPIDPTKPFPNGIASDSIWQGLYNEEKNQIVVESTKLQVDLSKSFDDITYTTKEVSLGEVRQITASGEKYTSWKDMNLNGTSTFISELGLRKNVSLSNLYKLGCGPDNLDWEGCK